MWMVRGVLGVGGRDEKEKAKELELEGSSSESGAGSDSSWHSAEPGVDELESFDNPTSGSDSETTFDLLPDYAVLKGVPANYYGANESDGAASTSSRHSSRGNSRVKGSRKRNTIRSKSYSMSKIREEHLETSLPRSRELRLDNEPVVQEDRPQSSRRGTGRSSG